MAIKESTKLGLVYLQPMGRESLFIHNSRQCGTSLTGTSP